MNIIYIYCISLRSYSASLYILIYIIRINHSIKFHFFYNFYIYDINNNYFILFYSNNLIYYIYNYHTKHDILNIINYNFNTIIVFHYNLLFNLFIPFLY